MKSSLKSKTSKEQKNKKNENNSKNNKDQKKSKEKLKAKQKEEEEEEKEEVIIPKENPKNIERFIYLTNYSDINSVKTLNLLFQEINSSAFNLSSNNDIISKELTPEEQNNNEIDYISGIQILDNDLRLTIIEGITGKAMIKVKDSFPKTKMNDQNHMIFSDCSILFDTRLYSKFNLTVKYIKLRKNLRDILTQFDIYINANKYRNIYDTFMNLGSILRSETLKDISTSNSFPEADKLLELERKYGDILNKEDLTGNKEIKKKDHIKSLSNGLDIINLTESNDKTIKSSRTNAAKSMRLMPINKRVKFILEEEKDKAKEENGEKLNNFLKKIKLPKNQKYLSIDITENNKIDLNNKDDEATNPKNDIFKNFREDEIIINNNNLEKNMRYNTLENEHNFLNGNKISMKLSPRVDARNKIFLDILKEREKKKLNSIEIFNKNKQYLNKMIRKKSSGRFCRPFEGEYNPNKEILFNALRKNYYQDVVNKMMEKYKKDKDHYYTYSEQALTLSFPMIEGFRNEEYLDYLDNKSKWISKNDFDRYKQPEREKIYFPRINKEI